jgi:hypothetical protein
MMSENVINEVMSMLLVEDRRSDLLTKFKSLNINWPTRTTEENKDELFRLIWDRDLSPTKKYIPWLFRQIELNPGLNPYSLDDTMFDISTYMELIEKRTNKGIETDFQNRLKNGDLQNFALVYDKILKAPKDINSYDSINALREYYKHIKEYTFAKDEIKKAKKESKKLYEDANYLIVQPLSYTASCVYGAGTKWCVSSRDTDRHFEDYTRSSKFVYVINKKSNDRKYGKFALRIPNNKKESTEVWDQQDARSTFDIMFEKMPGINLILDDILNISTNEYQILKKYQEGKIKEDEVFLPNTNFEIENGTLFMMFEDNEEYFKLFKYELYDYTISEMIAITSYSYGYSSREWTDSYTAKEEFDEGYMFGYLDDENLGKLKKIVKILRPSFDFLETEERRNWEVYKEMAQILGTYDRFKDDMISSYSMASDRAYEVGLEQAIKDEFCDCLGPLGIKMIKCFKSYSISVEDMLKLYEENSDPKNSIEKTIAMSITTLSLPDVIENSYEYRDEDTLVSELNSDIRGEIEKLYDSIMDNEDGLFDDIDEYSKIVDYIVKNFGFNVRKNIPTQPDTYFEIVGVEPQNEVLIEITKGYKRKRLLVSLEQLETLLKNYKLFDII